MGVQSNTITTLFDFQCCNYLYLNFFITHEVGKLWTGFVLHHIRFKKDSVCNYMYTDKYLPECLSFQTCISVMTFIILTIV